MSPEERPPDPTQEDIALQTKKFPFRKVSDSDLGVTKGVFGNA